MTLTRRSLLILPATAALATIAAACSPDEKSGIPITGTLSFAAFGTAPLTLTDGVVGTGFNMTAVLDSEQVMVSNQPWACYAPLPPDYPNYDIETSDGATYGFFLSFEPLSWSTGAHAIDGENVNLLVAMPDRFGLAQGGTVTLTAAPATPDASGNDCGLTVSGDIALDGEKDR